MPSPVARPTNPTLWTLTAGPAPELSRDVPSRSDVVVIGGGFTGLTAALHLARAGRSVIVPEAGRLGAGASGMNAGFVVPNFAKADPATVRQKLPRDRADALLSLVGIGADEVFATIAEEKISCDAAQTGWLQPAYGDDMAAILRQRAQDWTELGRPVEFLDARAIQDETGMDIYSGGLIDHSGGTIHPLNYLYGLAGAVMRRGGAICENSMVERVERHGGTWRVSLAGHEIETDAVILATNAFTDGIAARMGRTGVPLKVYQVATKPIDAETVARIARHRRPVGDTRSNLFTYRLDRDNRLISGGMAINPIGAFDRVGRAVVDRLASELRLPRHPGVEIVWSGMAIMTPDFLPRLYRFGDGFFGGIGCNGRGVAMTAQLGQILARLALGETAASLPIPLQSSRPLPFHRFTPVVASLALAHARFEDWRTARR
ncbi:FAD-binding oxidoreductase [Rhizobium sp. P40RR-XXII]|uniref:NAD(P)/FAD-dependent oxidoreductase n=1 Tax=unclassified Rhizobium TaxID=2613769 RepID=UPI001456C68C|nr:MULTISPECIES: FAD-binding oxidoreductase [unclassified Rhizobium]NLR86680.1 FAD-binding oxidoreductase [Rhizobium sp. P28RR-XV]NLS17352.1 FAD-binding oxidoreductase [Rhizobium sp. P40RR-XXII]